MLLRDIWKRDIDKNAPVQEELDWVPASQVISNVPVDAEGYINTPLKTNLSVYVANGPAKIKTSNSEKKQTSGMVIEVQLDNTTYSVCKRILKSNIGYTSAYLVNRQHVGIVQGATDEEIESFCSKQVDTLQRGPFTPDPETNEDANLILCFAKNDEDCELGQQTDKGCGTWMGKEYNHGDRFSTCGVCENGKAKLDPSSEVNACQECIYPLINAGYKPGKSEANVCGDECCGPEGCNDEGTGCKNEKECTEEPNACQECDTDKGELKYKDEDLKTTCGTGDSQVCCTKDLPVCCDDSTKCATTNLDKCVECKDDSDCADREDGKIVCDPDTQRCVSKCQEGENLCTSADGSWCCTDECGETYETCCSEGTCCQPRWSPFCAKYNSDGSCAETQCCNGSYRKIGNRAFCCPSGQQAICYSFDNDGNCLKASCSNCTGSTYCAKYNTEGKCQKEMCCDTSKNQIICVSEKDGQCLEHACMEPCPSGSSYYCLYPYDDGSCGRWSCCSGDVVCSEYNQDGICEEQTCCTTGSSTYCKQYYSNGQCRYQGCCDGTTYCMNYNLDGSCYQQGCCSGNSSNVACASQNTDGSCQAQACCSSSSTPYCWAYNNSGVCYSADCCPSPKVKTEMNGIQGEACCSSGQTAYCDGTIENGICTYRGGCCSGTVYCNRQNPDGTCKEQSCCTGFSTVSFIDNNGTSQLQTCCSYGEKPYCSVYVNGTCSRGSCCEKGKKVVEISGIQACCSPDETPYLRSSGFAQCCKGEIYCKEYNHDGSCHVQACCAAGGSVYCSSTMNSKDGSCSTQSCCPGTPYCSETYSNGNCKMQRCCGSGTTPYCYKFDTSGNCLGSDCCASGTSIYCNKYENGICVEKSCGSECAAIKVYDDGVFKQDVCCTSASGEPKCTKKDGDTCIQAACI